MRYLGKRQRLLPIVSFIVAALILCACSGSLSGPIPLKGHSTPSNTEMFSSLLLHAGALNETPLDGGGLTSDVRLYAENDRNNSITEYDQTRSVLSYRHHLC